MQEIKSGCLLKSWSIKLKQWHCNFHIQDIWSANIGYVIIMMDVFQIVLMGYFLIHLFRKVFDRFLKLLNSDNISVLFDSFWNHEFLLCLWFLFNSEMI